MVKQRIKPGEVISSEFLNYMYDAADAYNSELGVQEEGKHLHLIPDVGRAHFGATTENLIPPNSVFKLQHPLPGTYPDLPVPRVIYADDPADFSPLYSNGGEEIKAGTNLIPLTFTTGRIYTLAVDPASGMTAGDTAEPKADSWVLQTGGKEFLCVEGQDNNNFAKFIKLPAPAVGELLVGFVTSANILPRSNGTIEMYDKDDQPNGTTVTVYNPHDVTFYIENTDPGSEAPADRVLVLNAPGWPEPLILPFMLSPCQQIDPTFEPIDV